MPDVDLSAAIEGIVHEETQREGPGLDLTVASVSRVASPGQVDFGGGELAPAETTDLSPERRDPDDDYGWWELDGGTYLLGYNERLADPDRALVLQPRAALLERGAFHPTLHTRTLPPVPLSVPPAGIRLKENARVSTVLAPG